MNLIINWTSPVPYPSNNFAVSYRRNYDFGYTVFNTSGTTSGNTYPINVTAPANYEGYIQSSCNGENFSDQVSFGINAYQPVHVSIVTSGTTVIGTGTSIYPNSYATLANITVNYTLSGVPQVLTTTVTYPAGVTEFVILEFVLPGVVIINFTVNSSAPVFDNGGSLQQLDTVNTPSYFKFYWDGNTSGTTWFGSPLTLPSFILEAFNVTAVDIDNNPLAGNLIMTWVTDAVFNNAVAPYNQVTFSVYDPDSTLMGSTIYYPGTLGLQTAVISINQASAPISTLTEFTMITTWGDNTVSETSLFFLPNF